MVMLLGETKTNSLGDENQGLIQPTAGPNHAASALSMWAVIWCLLGRV
jgi:hypothetical protein